jgi:hypothetical protein
MTADPNAVALALQCRAVGLPEPLVDKYRFHPTRKWRLDLYWAYVMPRGMSENLEDLAVEIEGGAWIGGRHTRGAGFESDIEKYNELMFAGINLLRVTPAMVQDGTALGLIERAFGRGEAQP